MRLLLALLAGWASLCQGWDGCPDTSFAPLGARLCMTVTRPLPQREALAACLRHRRHRYTLWQLRTLDPGSFAQARSRLRAMGVAAVWLEARAIHPGGPLLHTQDGRPVWGWSVAACASYSLRTLRPVCAGAALPAVCLAPRYGRIRAVAAACPRGFFTAVDVQSRCLKVLRKGPQLCGARGATVSPLGPRLGRYVSRDGTCSFRSTPSWDGVANYTVEEECVMCQMKRPPHLAPELVLTFRPSTGLQLTVRRPQLLHEDPVRCFTDASIDLSGPLALSDSYAVSTPGDGHYWCEGQDLVSLQPVVSNKVLVAEPLAPGSGRLAILADRQNLPTAFSNAEEMRATLRTFCTECLQEIERAVQLTANRCQVKRIYKEENSTRILFHVTVSQYFPNELIKKLKYQYVRDTNGCPEEITEDDQLVYHWKYTSTGQSSTDHCHSRACVGDFDNGAFWDQPTNIPHCRVGSLTKRDASLTAVETVNSVQSSFAIMATSKDNPDLQEIVNNLDRVLSLEREDLLLLRTPVSAILQSFDSIVDEVQVKSRVITAESPRVSVLVSDTRPDIETRLVYGMVLGKSTRADDLLQEGTLREMASEMSTDQLMSTRELEAAVLLPRELHNNTKAGFAVFADDKSFQTSSLDNIKVNSRIISLRLQSAMYYNNLPYQEHVDIIFKPRQEQFTTKTCVFWDFSNGGAWSSVGCELVETSAAGMDLCRCNHATHFAEIITDANVDHNSAVLDIISIVGCSLSLLGLLAIATTAVVFREWRAQMGNKILLNLAAAVGLNMALFLTVASGVTSHRAACIGVGAALHYAVVSSFCWMLVSAVLQFIRLVTVLVYRGPHLLLKCCAFAWGAPLVPIITLLAIDPELYTERGSGFCYPQGIPFYTAVLLPIALVIFINLIAFGAILYHIFPSLNSDLDPSVLRRSASTKNDARRRFTLSLLLFFLFGLTWISGLLASSIVFAYLFCASATLQGFVLFLFFILGEKKMRDKWRNVTSWSYTDRRRTGSTYAPPVAGAKPWRPHTTVSAEGMVETSFEF